jgi:amino acid transporter
VLVTTPLWYAGFNVIPLAMGERSDKTPIKHIALILILSIGVVMVFYVLLILSASMALPRSDLLAIDLPAAGAFQAVLGSILMKKLVLCAGLLGLLTSWNAQFFAGTRALYALGRARLLPYTLAKVGRVSGTPTVAIAVLMTLSMIAASLGVGAISRMVNTGGLCFALLFIMVSIELIRLRRLFPHINAPYRVKYGKVVATVAAVCSIFLVIICIWQTRPTDSYYLSVEWLVFVSWVAIGIAVWRINKHSRQSIPEDHRKRIMLNDTEAV